MLYFVCWLGDAVLSADKSEKCSMIEGRLESWSGCALTKAEMQHDGESVWQVGSLDSFWK